MDIRNFRSVKGIAYNIKRMFSHDAAHVLGINRMGCIQNSQQLLPVKHEILLYNWTESSLLIGSICLYKFLCLPENWFKLAHRFT